MFRQIGAKTAAEEFAEYQEGCIESKPFCVKNHTLTKGKSPRIHQDLSKHVLDVLIRF